MVHGPYLEFLVDGALGLILGSSRGSNRRSPSRVNGTQPLDFSTQRMIRRRSPPGGRTSPGSSSCSTCVPSFLTRLVLNIFSQAELAIGTHVTVVNTHALVSGVHHGVENINSTVSDVHHGVSNIHVIVANIHSVISDMRREMQKREEGTDERNRMVSDSGAIHAAEQTLTII